VLGARTEHAEAGVRLTHALDGGSARRAGLAAGDVIVAVDGIRATHTGLERALAAIDPDSSVRVHAFRRDELLEVWITLAEALHDTCVLSRVDDVAETTRRQRDGWLHGRPG
jgi:predicted metalloprotease with PDZ domain